MKEYSISSVLEICVKKLLWLLMARHRQIRHLQAYDDQVCGFLKYTGPFSLYQCLLPRYWQALSFYTGYHVCFKLFIALLLPETKLGLFPTYPLIDISLSLFVKQDIIFILNFCNIFTDRKIQLQSIGCGLFPVTIYSWIFVERQAYINIYFTVMMWFLLK